ncbi:MAG: fumarate hydratase [Castellaniella sp.]
MTTVIREEDFVQSIADAVQFISFYHPADFIAHLAQAWAREQSAPAKDAMAQILTNSRLCVEGRRPLCQDTGVVNVFVRMGMQARIDSAHSLQTLCDEGVRRATLDADNPLRASMVGDPLFERRNTGDNTPAMVHVELVPGDVLEIDVAAKGAGSENKARLAMLNPGESLVDWVLETVPGLGAGWCPPGMLGIGVGGTAEKAMLLAKQSLMEPMDMSALIARGPANPLEALRIDLYEKVNALGIGAQGLGGLTTVLDVKIATFPTHAASKPVALIPNCAATRHVRFVLDGSGVAQLDPPPLSLWPEVGWKPDVAHARRVNLDTLTRDEVAGWQAGQTLLLSGRLLTGRDAAHARIREYLREGRPLPVDFRDRVIYYVGPVKAVRDEAVGPAGPTTATRMDDYTELMLGEAGLLAMVGKAERGPGAVAAIRCHGAASLIAVGGAAYLVSRAIRAARVLAFEDLGMEAIHEFEVRDMPVTVAVDATGTSVHESGPRTWKTKIARMRIHPV